jgi:putative ABC transport system permease protein
MSIFRLMLQQSLAGRGIFLLLAALVLAVTATTSLRFASETIATAIDQQAGQMLAGDLVITSNNPIDEKWSQRAAQAQLRQNNATVFGSMAQAGDQFILVNIKAVEQGFPLRGDLTLKPSVFHQNTAPQNMSSQKPIPAQGTIWLTPRLLDVLQVKLGDSIRIGDGTFKVAATIERDTNQETGMSGFSPTVIINQADVAATNAIQVGSRIDYRLILAGEPNQVKQFFQQYNKQMGDGVRLRSASQGNTRLMRPVEMLDDYSQIASVLTMLLCGVAIALACKRFVNEQLDSLAMIRCIGASQRQLALLYISLLLIILLVASVIGVALGAGIAYGLLQILHQALPALELRFQPLLLLGYPALTAVMTASILLIGFALPHLLQLIRVSPLRVIRRVEQTATWQSLIIAGLSFSLIFTFLLWQTGKVTLSLILLGALLLLLAGLWLIVRALLRTVQLTAFGQQYIRQPQQISVQIMALSLGLGLLTVLIFLRTDLMNRWQQSLPAGTPNQFVYGLPPDQKDQLQAELTQHQWPHTALYPNVRGRLISKNGQPFSAELVKQNNSLKRELNLTQSDVFPENNQMVAGTKFTSTHQVSVEQEVAEQLGIALGDTITMSLPEGDLNAKVVSLRTVSWDSFTPNFFFIYSPNTFDANAGSYLGSFFIQPEQRADLAKVIATFPTTVFIDVDAVLNEVRRLIAVLGQALGLLAGLVSVAGVLVLLASLQLLVDERQREVILLRTIGMSRVQLRRRLGVELALIGTLSGVTAVILAELVAILMSWRLSIPYHIHYWWWLIMPVGMTLLAVVIGQLRLRPLWHLSPILILRRD